MKKLFTLLFAAMGLTAMADNTVTVKYDFENYRLDSKGKYYEWFEKNADETENNLWATGNEGYKYIKSSAKPDEYPSAVSKEGRTGNAVKLETKDTYSFVSKKSPIAAGNIFIGQFAFSFGDIANPIKMTKFGKVFTQKPLSFSFYYKYAAGTKLQDIDRNEITGKTDKANAYAVLYDNNGGSFQADGANILTNEYVVGVANVGELDNADEWTKSEAVFEYTKEIDKEKLANGGYNLALVFTSSINGSVFEGAIGSVMYVDDVELVCEAEAEETAAKEFTDNLVVQLGDGDPLPAQTASIFVTDNGDGKYTLSLPNFMLGEGPEAMGIGTINLANVEGTETDGVVVLSTTQTIKIEEGDKEGVLVWFGPNLGELPVVLNAEMKEDKLFAQITIPFGDFDIFVTFGEKISTGIDCIVPGVVEQQAAVFTLDGKKATTMKAGNVYIIRKADGKTVKVVK